MRRILKRITIGTTLLTLLSLHSGAAATGDVEGGVAVETITASPSVLTETIDVVGTLTAKRRADVKSEYAGIIREIYFTEWVDVKSGDPLALLDTREPEAISKRVGAAVEMARADQLQAKAALARAEREFARLENLKTAGLATRQSLDEAATEREVARAKRDAAEAQRKSAEFELDLARTRLSKTLIRAPLGGVIAERGVNVGDLVGEAGSNRILFKIVDNRQLDLKITVPARFAGELRIGMPVSFSTASFPNRTFEGRVAYINPSLNEVDRSLKVVAEVPNDPVTLRDGMFITGQIVLRERPDVLQIPRGALITWDMNAHTAEIYVVENGVVLRKPVETGSVKQDRVEIIKGLKAGERVVSAGGFNVSDGATVKARNMN
ncbi:MAG: efflux RND transporter periplasmic adaptor subunit [Pseudomonadota bacterium]